VSPGGRRALAVIVALSAIVACDRARDDRLTTDSSAGQVSPDSATVGVVFHDVKYTLTSDNYRKWLVAQAALDSIAEPSEMPLVDLRDPTDEDIEATVDFLDDQDAARRAIERSGLSVKDFVLTSVALGQALSVAGRELVPRDNRVLVETNRPVLDSMRIVRRFHVVDNDEDDHDDGGRGTGGKRKGHHHHGHKRGRGHGKH
jgi:hypothetical protein